MRVLHLPLVIILFVCFVFTGNAQTENHPDGHNSCIYDQMRKNLAAKDPTYIQKEQQFNEKIRQLTIAKNSNQSNLRNASEECLIPVVFHIVTPVGQTVDQFLPDLNLQTRITNCLNALNNAFGGLSPYAGIDSKIKFIIAQRDVNGNYTPGYTQLNDIMSNLSAVGSGTDLTGYDDGLINTIVAQNGGTTNFLFPNSQYINIIIVNSLTENNQSTAAGYAYFPNRSNADIKSDVIIMSKSYFGAADRNICIIHEMGHFLGLYHTFQNCNNMNCDPSQASSCTNTDCTKYGDLVCDTPPDASANPLSNCNGTENSCTADALNDLATNYMDYGAVSCKNAFTQGQIDRMNITLANFRPSLCGSSGTWNLCPKQVSNLTVIYHQTANGNNNLAFYPILSLANGSTDWSGFYYEVDFGDGTPVTLYDATVYRALAPGTTITHSYSDNRTYQVKLTLLYKTSPTASPLPECSRVSMIISFASQCPFPIPTFASSKIVVTENESVAFTNTATCPTSGTGLCTYNWFKDGQSFSTDPISASNIISSTSGVKQIQLKMTYNGCVSISEPQAIQVGGNLCKDKRYSKFIGNKQIFHFENNLIKKDLDINPIAFMDEAAALICDNASGDVILFTNGASIYDKNSIAISGGSNVFGFGQTSSHQGSIILQHPDPAKKNLYFVFATGSINSNETLRYVTVDIKQGVNGAVIGNVVTLVTNIPEKMVTITKPDGSGYYVLTHEVGTNRFITVEVNNTGVLAPKYSFGQTVLLSHTDLGGTWIVGDMQSNMMINRQGTQVGICYGRQNKVEIYNFDSQTGLVGSRITIIDQMSTSTIGWYGPMYLQFSPDGTKLYVYVGGVLKQYDLGASDIKASAIEMPYNSNNRSVRANWMLLTYDEHFIMLDSDTEQMYEMKVPNAPASGLNNPCGLVPIFKIPTNSQNQFGLSEEPINIVQKTEYVVVGLNCVKPNVKGVVYTLNVPANPVNTYQWNINQGYPPLANIVGSSTGTSVVIDYSTLSGTIELQCQVNGVCGTDLIKKTITIDNSCTAPTCTIEIKTANNNTEPAILIPTCHPSVTLNATAGFVTYAWKKDGVIIPNARFSTLAVSQAGVYTVSGVDAQNCSATSNNSITVIDGLTITGDDQICPNVKASLNVNIAGVVGNYYVQWIQNGGTPTYTPSGGGGDYYAMVVLPTFAGCTLTTAPKEVQLLPAPSPYTVSTDKHFLCGDAATLTATAPGYSAVPITDNIWSNGVGQFAGMPATNVVTNVLFGGSYFVTSKAVNGCTAISNVVFVTPPILTIKQRCTSGGIGIELIADQNIPGGNYTWKNAAGTVVATTQSYVPSIVGTYTASTTSTLCPTTASTEVCTQPPANVGTNLVTRGDFNITGVSSPICTNYAVSSDLTCSDATTTPLNSGTWPSNFKITSDAGPENLNKWSGKGFADPTKPNENYCLIADGRVTLNDERVWYQTISVENCATYTFRALIDNIIVNEAEIPRVSLRIKNGPYNSFIKATTVFANQSNWVELSGTWKSPLTGTVEVSVVLDGGGFVGRDIAVDEIYFAKTNCSSLNEFRPGRSCNAVTSMGIDKYVCSGQGVQIGMNAATDPSLTYSWTAPGFSSTAANPTVTPTVTNTYKLVVTDNVNNCTATDYVTVTVIIPEVTITKDLTTGCTATQVKANLFSGIPNPQYEWQVNGVPSVTNTTGVFSLTGITTGATVRCRLVTACSPNVYSNIITVGNSAPVTVTDASICSGKSTQLHANMSGGIAPYTYTWTALTGAVPAAEAEPIVSPTATTTYGLTYQDGNNCTFTGSVTVTVNALPPAVTINPSTACVGTQVWITANQGAGNQLVSLTDPSFMNRTNGTGGVGYVSYLQSINAAGTGDFVAVSKSNMGCERTTVIPFTALAAPVPMTISVSPTTACVGVAISVSVEYGVGNTLTSFTDPSNISRIGGGGPGVMGFSANVTSAGTSNFIGISTNAQGCSTTVSVPFTSKPKPAATIQSTGTLICSGSAILLSTDAIGVSYQWYSGTTLISGATNASYRTSTAGAYTMNVTDGNSCSNTSTGITLTSSTLGAMRVQVNDATNLYCTSTPVAMTVGKTVQLNGTNQFVDVTGFNYPASGTTYGGPITVEFWIKSNGTSSSAFTIGGGNDNPNRAQAHIPYSDGNLHWDYGNAAGNGRISTSFASYVDKWTHVALVSEGNGGSYKAIYLNGVNVASSTAASDGPDIALSGLKIGKWTSYFTSGKIDEFRVWNKVLNLTEVQTAMTTLYEAGTPNLMGSWGFDEASGTTVNNDAFSAQTGTMMNSATRALATLNLTYTWSPSAYLNASTGTTVIPNTSVERTYTVKGVNANGCSAYAQVVATPNASCKEVESEQGSDLARTGWDVEVYPNPTEGDVHISFVNISDDADLSIEVIGMDGVVIFSKEGVDLKEVYNLRELPSGLYLVRVKNGTETKTRKVVVVK